MLLRKTVTVVWQVMTPRDDCSFLDALTQTRQPALPLDIVCNIWPGHYVVSAAMGEHFVLNYFNSNSGFGHRNCAVWKFVIIARFN